MNMDARGVVKLDKPADQIVDANSVNGICTKYSIMWRQIGLKLGLSDSVLDNVEADHHEQRKRFEVTLSKWMKLDNNSATWGILELAVTNANREELSLGVLSELPRDQVVQTSASFQTQQGDSSQLGEQLQPPSSDEKDPTKESTTSSSKEISTSKFTTPHQASTEFGILVHKIIRELQQNERENLEGIKTMCSCLTIKDDPDVLLFDEEQQEAIEACDKLRILFTKYLRHCWRYDDFSFLKKIIQSSESSDRCEELLSQYEQKLDSEMKLQHIYDHCKQENQAIPAGYYTMVAIIHGKIFSRITKMEHDQIKEFIAQYCEVNSYVIPPFHKAAKSSLVLEFIIPVTAVSHMVETATRNSAIFLENDFVYLRIAMTVIFDKRDNVADSGLLNGAPLHTRPPETANDLCKHVPTFQKYANISLLLRFLTTALTKDEIHMLSDKDIPERHRIHELITEFLPKKTPAILDTLKQALVNSLTEDESSGHQIILQEVFTDTSQEVNLAVAKPEKPLVNADVISEETECFIGLERNFISELQHGSKEVVNQRLQDVVKYFCHVRCTNGDYYLKENVRDELCSNGLNFEKLFNCLYSKSSPPVISNSNVTVLHKIIKVLNSDELSKQVVVRLTRLLTDYEINTGIAPISQEPCISPGSASVKVKVTNARSGSPKLKNAVRNSFWQSLKFKFLGSERSVVLYWEFSRDNFQQLLRKFEQVHESKTGIQQFRITKVEAFYSNQIYLEMEITDPDLLQLSQQQHFVADDIAPEQDKFIILLIKINRLVGDNLNKFIKETSPFHAYCEDGTFFGMVNKLISENKLHCYDISYVQLFLYILYKQALQDDNKAALLAALNETQDYEPVPTGSSLSSVESRCRSGVTITTITQTDGTFCISYEVMISLKYGLSQLLNISPLSFHYISWEPHNDKYLISWHTTKENFDTIEKLLCFQENLSTAFLKVTDKPDINFPHVKFNFEINNMQILLDGSPLFVPDVEDTGNEVSLPLLCRVGHVCATCFIDFNWAFRLVWLHCFKPQEHHFPAKVNAVYSTEDSSLYRVRRYSDCILERCLQKNCSSGRKCPRAHSRIELQYWKKIQQSTTGIKSYKDVLNVNKPLKHLSVVKKKFPINYNPRLGDITGNLTVDNYARKFHELLYWEEKQHIEELNKRCVDPVDIVIFQDEFKARDLIPNKEISLHGYIAMKDADSAQYIMQASKSVRFELPQSCKLVAEIDSVSFKKTTTTKMEHVPIMLMDRNDNENVQKFKAYMHRTGRQGDAKFSNILVQYQIKHQYFVDLHNSIENVPRAIVHKLFPSSSKKRLQEQSLNTNFSSPFTPDHLQLEAITSMLSASTEAPFLLVGPFGTGKTHVLACAAAAIVIEDVTAKVLIVTHHNKSADTFISKYFGTIESTKVLPVKVAPIRITTENLNQGRDKPYFVKFNDERITKELLDERRIVITTFLTALRFASAEKLPQGYFTHILIDEGAQTREPETIASLIFANERTKIVIAGDHLQVGPKTLVLGINAIKHGLAESLLERLYHYYNDSQWISHLLINYRSHEAIMRVSSNLFYNSTVISESTAILHPSTCYPLIFVCTSLNYGKFQNVIDIDMCEVDVVLKEVKKYTHPWPAQWGSQEKSSVCIVASNRNQVNKFHEKLGILHSYVEVLPSFDIQGREFRAVFVSTNEATDSQGYSKNPTKSMCDPFVFNTVITRAKSLFVCVGNPYFICQLEEKMKTGKRCWATYIQCCLDCETFSSLNTSFGQSEKEALQNALHISQNFSAEQTSSGDNIVRDYLSSLAKFEKHKKALEFSKTWGDIQCDDQSKSDDCEDGSTYIKCIIYFESHHHAMAREVENHQRIIYVNGQNNLRGASMKVLY